MKLDSIYIYTDASFNKDYELATLGYSCFESTSEHNTIFIDETDVKISLVKEVNNIRAELRAAITALQCCPRSNRVVLFTDCRTVCNLPARRANLEGNNYVSKSQNLPFANADLYRKFYVIYDKVNPELVWVKGHVPKKKITNKIEKNFAYLDRLVRKTLRQAVSELPDT